MHPNLATFIAFCDGEIGASGNLRIEKHLAKCQSCREQVQRIRSEKSALSAAGAGMQAIDNRQGLAGLLSEIDRWQGDPASTGPSQLRSRIRRQIETYLGAAAISVVEPPGMPAEELLGRAGEILDIFLGQAAAEAIRDDVFAGLVQARSEEWR